MQVTERIHSLEIPFKIPVAPGRTIDRTVFVFLVLGESITLIDTGVSGSESKIFEYVRKVGRDPRENFHVDSISLSSGSHGSDQVHSRDNWLQDSGARVGERVD